MRKLLNIKVLFILSVLAVGLSSCDSEERDRLMDADWEVDLGRLSRDNKPLYSVFTFDRGGRGIEKQYFQSNVAFYGEDFMDWNFFYDYDNYIEVIYYNGDTEYFDRVEFTRNGMHAIHYLNRYDFEMRSNGKPVFLKER